MATRNSQISDILATVVGLVLATAAGLSLYLALLPWKAALGMVIVGLYMALPRRMQTVGTSLVSLFKFIKTKGGSNGSVR